MTEDDIGQLLQVLQWVTASLWNRGEQPRMPFFGLAKVRVGRSIRLARSRFSVNLNMSLRSAAGIGLCTVGGAGKIGRQAGRGSGRRHGFYGVTRSSRCREISSRLVPSVAP